MRTYHVSRRAVLAGLAAAAVAGAGLARLPRLWEPPLDFEPMDAPAGFRRLAGGAVSGGPDPLAGLSADGAGAAPGGEALCPALFGEGVPPGAVPVASFSDYNCPYCRVLTERLARLEDDLGLAVRWHELPLLGQASVDAARGALAAARQGGYAPFHERLMKTAFRPTPAYLSEVAKSVGIDPERMVADMHSASVTDELAQSRRLAAAFGIAGTPALVVGRTLVVGEIDARTLRRLVAAERAAGGGPCA